LISLLALIEATLDDQGREHLDGRFLEWPTSEDPTAIDAGLQALTVLALRAGAEICVVLGAVEAAARADAAGARAARATRTSTTSKQANALLTLADMAHPETVNRDILARAPYRGLSTFYGYYVLQARALAGDTQGCLDLIRAYWGGMLDMGATTFWEGFELDWMVNATRIDELPVPGKSDIHADYGGWCYQGLRHSLCHGWAAGPTAWLTQHVLGLAPVTPGCTEMSVCPNLGDLQWAHGTVPTPHGIAEVSHTRQADGTVQTELKLPGGVRRRDSKQGLGG
jgi:alpha-L-rhamnosidase